MTDKWTRDQLLVAFNLYCRIPFSKTKANNPSVIQIAQLVGRSPAAVAMKLGNFGSFDPALRNRGIKGLSQTAKRDREIWDEFNQNWGKLTVDSVLAKERLLSTAQTKNGRTDRTGWSGKSSPEKLEQLLTGPTEVVRETRVRLHQRFFREAVLASYGISCCVCSNPVPELLTAGHIIPWAEREDLRANPRNGLCLCSLHHSAFDCGLWTLDESFKIILSSHLTKYLPSQTLEANFLQFSRSDIRMPDKFWPQEKFLAHHRLNLFRA